MTRRDFELIAGVVATLPLGGADRLVVAQAFADRLPETNARFDRARFVSACMGGQLTGPMTIDRETS